MIELHMHLLT